MSENKNKKLFFYVHVGVRTSLGFSYNAVTGNDFRIVLCGDFCLWATLEETSPGLQSHGAMYMSCSLYFYVCLKFSKIDEGFSYSFKKHLEGFEI